MTELLDRDRWQVVRVLQSLEDDDVLKERVLESSKRVGILVASVIGFQVNVNGGVVLALADVIKTGVLDALVINTAMSGDIPFDYPYNGASTLAFNCLGADIPCFRVSDGRYPQRYRGEQVCLDVHNVVHLQNAFFGDIKRVFRVVHGALNSDSDSLVVRSAVRAYFEQTQWPPEGWRDQSAELVRG